jgi:hypothetical protein
MGSAAEGTTSVRCRPGGSAASEPEEEQEGRGGRRDRVEVLRRLHVGMGLGRRHMKGVRLLQGGKELGLG